MTRWWRRPEAGLFALLFGAYAYFYQAGGWNENVRFDLTRAIVEDHSLTIDRFANNTGDLAEKDGHLFCDKAPGASLMGVLPYAMVYAAFGSRHPSLTYLAWSSWLTTVVAVSFPSALGVVAIAFLFRALGVPPGPRYALAAAWGLATLAFPYATLFYAHQLVAALLVTSLMLLVRIRRGVDPPTRVQLIAIGALGGWAIVCEYPAAIAALAIGVYAFSTVKPRALIWIVAAGLGPGLVLAWYHWTAFGAPWHLPYDFSTQSNRSQGFFMGIGTLSGPALWGILGSPFRGLFYSAPWLLLAVPGAVRLWRRAFRGETIVCASIVTLFVSMNASLADWDGGWAAGPRYLVPCIPFLVVLSAGLLVPPVPRMSLGVRIAIIAFVGYSAFLMFAATAVQPEVHFKIKEPFGEYILPRFVRGDVATSDQSIDMKFREKKGKSYAWNIGEQLGLSGFASLAPLLVWCASWSALLVRNTRRYAT